MHIRPSAVRSLLFAPASRPDLVAKLPRSCPDLATIDLEDGVPDRHLASARLSLPSLVASLDGRVAAVCVRVSTYQGPRADLDLAAAAQPGVAAIVVPKVEDVDALVAFAERLDAHGSAGTCGLIVGLETARGVARAFDLVAASDRIVGAYFGAEDFISSMGGRRTPAGAEVLHARSRVVLAARAAGRFALDQASPDFRDMDAFRRDAETARDLGYDGKLCIHPDQVIASNLAFTATPDEIVHARRIVDEFDAAIARGDATPVIDGCMVDDAVVRRFRALAACHAQGLVP